jgi:outer membrane scaffolding protein for murein synthesis (MipA/OmpV family)
VRLGTSLVYRVSPTWVLTGSLTHTTLLGDTRRSPIVQDENSLSTVLAVGYSF